MTAPPTSPVHHTETPSGARRTNWGALAFGIFVLCLSLIALYVVYLTAYLELGEGAFEHRWPILAVEIGFAYSLLLFGVVYGLMNSRGQLRTLQTQRRAEQELARLASIPEQSPSPILEVSTDGTLTYANIAARASFAELEAPGARHPVFDGLVEAMDVLRQGHKPFVTREVTVGNQVYQEQISGVPGRALVRLYLNDITERHRTIERLEQLMRGFLSFGTEADENIEQLVRLCGGLLNAQWVVYTRLDEGLLRAVGRWNAPEDYPAASPLAGSVGGAVLTRGGDDVFLVREALTSPYAAADPVIRRYQVQTYLARAVKSGAVYVGVLHLAYVNDVAPGAADKHLISIIASAIGVEEARRWLAVERRRHMTELQEANRQLEALGAMRDEFVATISHELRTPLTAIKEGVNLLLDKALGAINDEQQDFLKTVDENVERLTELIDHLLDLSKIQAGRLKVIRRRVEVAAVIDSTLKGYKPLVGRRTLRVQLESLPPIFADPARVTQILGNLLSNAVKFTAEDGSITVMAAPRDRFVAMSVRDTGAGIAPDDLSKLFQRFSQVGNLWPRRGTGLGLVLCKELVAMQGGTIGVESRVGQGSTFTFTMPIYTPEFALEEDFKEAVETAKATPHGTVGVIALNCEPFVGRAPAATPDARQDGLERLGELLRSHLHAGDAVLSLDPHWVIIISVAQAAALEAIAERLRRLVHEFVASAADASAASRIRSGMTAYPADGTQIQTLVAAAMGATTR